ncbi:MAG TPA: geranylgeranyl reductase family protein [Acidimicrobiia bacterium]|nr:geranylgeranyl reductase family protein [Acidimicrobiia bacterium]
MAEERTEVVVVGAGPAGTAAALTARRHGLDVVLLDRARFPRDKACGDGLTTAALRALERLGLPAHALGIDDTSTVRAAVLRAPSGRIVELPLPEPGRYAAVVRRVELDRALTDVARARGVDVRDGCALRGLVADAEGVTVELSDATTLRTRFVVAADGHYSPTRRLLEPDTPTALGEHHAMRQYFSGVRDPRLWVVFDRDLLPGYAWVFPLGDGTANVGVGMPRGRGQGRLHRQIWTSLTDRPGVRDALGPDARPVGAARAWPVPTAFDPARLTSRVSPRVLFAGDAAAVVDPLTGEGIAQALVTGGLAADAIAAGASAHPRAVAARYRADTTAELGRDLRFASALRHTLATARRADVAIRAVDASDWTRRSFARWMFEDYPRAVLLTPRRWRRGMMQRPGAYRAPAA